MAPLGALVLPAVEGRDHKQCQQGRGDQSTDHHNGQGTLDLGTRACGDDQGQQAQGRGQCGHEDRAHLGAATGDNRQPYRLRFFDPKDADDERLRTCDALTPGERFKYRTQARKYQFKTEIWYDQNPS